MRDALAALARAEGERAGVPNGAEVVLAGARAGAALRRAFGLPGA